MSLQTTASPPNRVALVSFLGVVDVVAVVVIVVCDVPVVVKPSIDPSAFHFYFEA
ncbi:MAG: hypothetical protein P4L69_22690 [Desulfosporosinus sp.]|nr:hypothetical protein [Desulfosporosinus sp.]